MIIVCWCLSISLLHPFTYFIVWSSSRVPSRFPSLFRGLADGLRHSSPEGLVWVLIPSCLLSCHLLWLMTPQGLFTRRQTPWSILNTAGRYTPAFSILTLLNTHLERQHDIIKCLDVIQITLWCAHLDIVCIGVSPRIGMMDFKLLGWFMWVLCFETQDRRQKFSSANGLFGLLMTLPKQHW